MDEDRGTATTLSAEEVREIIGRIDRLLERSAHERERIRRFVEESNRRTRRAERELRRMGVLR